MKEKVEVTEEDEEEEAEEIEEEKEVPAEEAEAEEKAEERLAEEETGKEAGEEATLEVEEEKEVEKEEKKEIEEEEIVEEKFYTIPLRRAWISPRKKRAPRAMRILKSFVKKHMKLRTEAEGEEEAERLVVSSEVNEKIWGRGIEKPPRKIRVRAVKDKEGVITIYLAEGD